MKVDAIINLSVFLAALAAIGVGIGTHDWGAALAVVGSIVLATVTFSRVAALRTSIIKPQEEAAPDESA